MKLITVALGGQFIGRPAVNSGLTRPSRSPQHGRFVRLGGKAWIAGADVLCFLFDKALEWRDDTALIRPALATFIRAGGTGEADADGVRDRRLRLHARQDRERPCLYVPFTEQLGAAPDQALTGGPLLSESGTRSARE